MNGSLHDLVKPRIAFYVITFPGHHASLHLSSFIVKNFPLRVDVYSFSHFLYESSSSRTSVREAETLLVTRRLVFPCLEVGYWA
jgi:hypothetical protein